MLLRFIIFTADQPEQMFYVFRPVESEWILCEITGEGGWFVNFRIFKSILHFVNWISLYFFYFL